MFVRFAVSRRDKYSHVRQGLFHASAALCDSLELDEAEESFIEEVCDWFNRHLPHPKRFARSRRRRAQAKAISWYKDSAKEFIARMEFLATVLGLHGYVVERLTTDRPGYVVYEDAYQVVAEPFRRERYR